MKAIISVPVLLIIGITNFVLMPSNTFAEEQAVPARGLEATESLTPDEAETPLLIMDQPLDGSSVEAFKAGLEKVDREASEKEYRGLMSALDYLLYYDLSAQRKKEKLYASLDGKSPNQIKEIVASSRTR